VRLLAWARERFWFLPALCAVLAGAVGIAMPVLDTALLQSAGLPPFFLFTGGPEGARALLSAIISSMISFTALVFSITIVVLQLTSGQFSPRVLRTFLRDRFNQVTLGVFVATFVYAMVVLRAVRGTADVSPFVPQLGVTTAFVFVLGSVLVFLLYLHHIAQAIRAATIIDGIGEETRVVLDRRHPADDEADGDPPGPDRTDGAGGRLVLARRPGVVQSISMKALADAAQRAGATVEGLRSLGEFVAGGAALFRVYGDGVDDERLIDAVLFGKERSLDEDVGFGLRQLVDIASRALSPGVNDPTTAVQVLDQLHDLLRRLAARPLPVRRVVRRDGRIVASTPTSGFADYLDLAVDEIHHWGGEDPRIRARLCGLLRDVHTVARPEHRLLIARKLAGWDELPPPAGVVVDLTPSDVGLRSRAGPSRGYVDGER
jgi:uncharacterized membrane protein